MGKCDWGTPLYEGITSDDGLPLSNCDKKATHAAITKSTDI